MAETDWFNKPVENSRELILKEAFKLFLQKNVEKVTVPELERVTKLQRGAIFYHFKDKEAIFKDAVKQYFFSPLNIFIIRKTKCSPLFKRSDISYKTKRPPKNNFPKYSRGSKKSTGKFCFSQCFFL